MSRLYNTSITVTVHAGHIHHFTWRGTTYRVKAELGTYHLLDRWWEPASSAAEDQPAHLSPSDRHYYRLECTSGLLCEIYHDTVSGVWVLARVYD